MPAMIHLTRLGYQYVGKMSHVGTEGQSERTAGTSFDEETNILLYEFQKAFARFNPDKKDKWLSVLDDIKKELNDD